MNSYRSLIIKRDKLFNRINDLSEIRCVNPDKQIRLALQRQKLKNLYNFYTKLIKELDKEKEVKK